MKITNLSQFITEFQRFLCLILFFSYNFTQKFIYLFKLYFSRDLTIYSLFILYFPLNFKFFVETKVKRIGNFRTLDFPK